ncbi:oxidase [Tenacibaculum pacificus]|uniref:oxidase n=1 Tax=Tenacibaculum TaxID=104267 RepID=UPI0022F3C625|nr:oxidase [Tenacibaculum pacificus]WBX72904.1 oxidase [Tenacibaculum pacificus]
MKDLLLDENGDLLIQNGDFVIGNSSKQHQLSILTSAKGEFKEVPEIGVGIEAMIADDAYTDLLIEAKKNLEYDGMKINNIEFTREGKLNIDGNYK